MAPSTIVSSSLVSAMFLVVAGCAPTAAAPSLSPVDAVHLVMEAGPRDLAIYRFEGTVTAGRAREVPVLGPVVCPRVPCSAWVAANDYLVGVSPSFPSSSGVQVPSSREVHVTVHPGGRSEEAAGAVTALLGLGGTFVGGALLTPLKGPAFGAPVLATGAAALITGILLMMDSSTRLRIVGSDGAVHF